MFVLFNLRLVFLRISWIYFLVLQALDTFNTAVVSPVYFVSFTSLTIFASIIMFKVIIFFTSLLFDFADTT